MTPISTNEVFEHNRRAWDRNAAGGCEWSTPVSAETIARARQGEWAVILTPRRPVPRAWFGEVNGARILCLASGGGQQGPILAAAGAQVVSFDASAEQLARDRAVADREGLPLECVQGDMADLSRFDAASFDVIFHPISNVFVPDIAPVWTGCYRILRPGGALLAGFMNPAYFLFDHEAIEAGAQPVVVHRLPYSDVTSPVTPARREALDRGQAYEFSHSLDSQMGGQLAAGFLLAGLYEDWWDIDSTPLDAYMPTSIATRAIKPH